MKLDFSSHEPANPPRTIWWTTSIWICCIAICVPSLLDHMARPGANAAVHNDHWPASSPLSPASEGQTLLLFAHPHCPCTLSTLAELERILVFPTPVPLRAILILPTPENAELHTKKTTKNSVVIEYARRIPGLSITFDNEALITRTFGIRTSGHCLLYGTDHTLLYSGGLTPLRGHEGACDGNIALKDHLFGRKPSTRYAPVFGCSLYQGNLNEKNGI